MRAALFISRGNKAARYRSPVLFVLWPVNPLGMRTMAPPSSHTVPFCEGRRENEGMQEALTSVEGDRITASLHRPPTHEPFDKCCIGVELALNCIPTPPSGVLARAVQTVRPHCHSRPTRTLIHSCPVSLPLLQVRNAAPISRGISKPRQQTTTPWSNPGTLPSPLWSFGVVFDPIFIT